MTNIALLNLICTIAKRRVGEEKDRERWDETQWRAWERMNIDVLERNSLHKTKYSVKLTNTSEII